MKINNLLPREEQNEIRKEQMLSHLRRFNFWSIASYLIIVLLLIGARILMEQNLSNIDSDIRAEKQIIAKADNAAIKKQIDFNNGSITDYNSLAAGNPVWSKILEGFAGIVPDGILIKNFSASMETSQINVSGIGQTRDAV